MKINIKTASLWSSRAHDGEGTANKPGQGRPTSVTPAIQKRIKEAIQTRKHGSSRKTARLVGLSKDTVRNVAKSAGLNPYRKPKRQPLSEKNKKDRMKFAKNHKGKTDWGKVIFSDEHSFELWSDKGRGHSVQWAPAPPRPQWRPSGKSVTTRIWLGISAKGVTDIFFHNSPYDQEGYQECLELALLPSLPRLYPEGGYLFQHDGDGSHTAKSTQKWCSEKLEDFIKKDSWPGNSPDLNPIENFWAMLDQAVYSRKYKNLAEFEKIVVQEINKFPQEMITKLVMSMDKRLKKVIEVKGERIKY